MPRLVAINLVSGGPRWHSWPLAGWGLGLAIQGIVNFANLRGEGLHERLLERDRAAEARSLGVHR
jgi:hypothetical protein